MQAACIGLGEAVDIASKAARSLSSRFGRARWIWPAARRHHPQNSMAASISVIQCRGLISIRRPLRVAGALAVCKTASQMTASPATSRSSALDRRAEARMEPDWAQAALSDPTRASGLARHHPAGTARADTRIAFLDAAHTLLAASNHHNWCCWAGFTASAAYCWSWHRQPGIGARRELRGAALGGGRAGRGSGPAADLRARAGGVALASSALWSLRRAHRPRSAGHVLACTRCGTEFFPRIDPA